MPAMRIFLLCCLITGAIAAESLTVAVKEAPPFAINDGAGWSGISVELWQAVTAKLGQESRFVDHDLPALLQSTAAGTVDVGVGAITATLEREKSVDFSHPFISTGLGIAVGTGEQAHPAVSVLSALISWRFLEAIGALGLLLALIGTLVWLAERKRNADEFGGSTVAGIGAGFWWSAVTMTTVGYGDKSPRTPLGRFIGLGWMFASIILISGFTAAIATSLTVGALDTGVQSLADCADARIGVVGDTSGADFARERGFVIRTYATPKEALTGLADGQVDAVIHDAPILAWHLQAGAAGHLLAEQVQRQDYAFVLPPGSALREPVNRAILELVEDGSWRRIQQRYLGH